MDVLPHTAPVYDPDLLAMRKIKTALHATSRVVSTSFELSGQFENQETEITFSRRMNVWAQNFTPCCLCEARM